MFSNKKLESIFNRTKGHCHFCGDELVLHKYGCKDLTDLEGAWESDHIIQKGKGGSKEAENCLPACVRCNRLRWHRKGKELRDLIFLGLVAKNEMKNKTNLGNMIKALKDKRIKANIKRRRNIG